MPISESLLCMGRVKQLYFYLQRDESECVNEDVREPHVKEPKGEAIILTELVAQIEINEHKKTVKQKDDSANNPKQSFLLKRELN